MTVDDAYERILKDIMDFKEAAEETAVYVDGLRGSTNDHYRATRTDGLCRIVGGQLERASEHTWRIPDIPVLYVPDDIGWDTPVEMALERGLKGLLDSLISPEKDAAQGFSYQFVWGYSKCCDLYFYARRYDLRGETRCEIKQPTQPRDRVPGLREYPMRVHDVPHDIIWQAEEFPGWAYCETCGEG